MSIDFVPVAAIVVICYLIGMALKAWDKFDDRKIPVVMGICGAVLGIVAYFVAADLIPANDPITALAIGIFSGLSATGVNQIVKQSQKTE